MALKVALGSFTTRQFSPEQAPSFLSVGGSMREKLSARKIRVDSTSIITMCSQG